jgi:hypothetical protein
MALPSEAGIIRTARIAHELPKGPVDGKREPAKGAFVGSCLFIQWSEFSIRPTLR